MDMSTPIYCDNGYLCPKENMDLARGIAKMEHFRETFQNHVASERQGNLGKILHSKQRKKQKRFRSAFTTMQICLLENEFKKCPYVTTAQRQNLSKIVNLPERAIKIWFQNRRMKEKRDVSKEVDVEGIANHDTEIPTNYDNADVIQNSVVKIEHKASTPLVSKNIFEGEQSGKSKNKDTVIHINQTRGSTIEKNSNKKKNENYDFSESHTVAVNNATSSHLPQITLTVDSKYITRATQKSGRLFKNKKNPQNRQQVVHIQPFCQVKEKASQKAPQNPTANTSKDSERNQVSREAHSQQQSGYVPLNLTKYFTDMPPVQHYPWSGVNFIPVIPAPAAPPRGLTAIPTDTPPMMTTAAKCTCNCHQAGNLTENTNFASELMTPRYQSPYPLFYTKYVPHIMTSLPPNE